MFNGPKLRQMRESRGWSQFDLAMRTSYTDAAGQPRMIRPEQIAKYEKTLQPSTTKVSLIAAAFGEPVETFLIAPTLMYPATDGAANG